MFELARKQRGATVCSETEICHAAGPEPPSFSFPVDAQLEWPGDRRQAVGQHP